MRLPRSDHARAWCLLCALALVSLGACIRPRRAPPVGARDSSGAGFAVLVGDSLAIFQFPRDSAGPFSWGRPTDGAGRTIAVGAPEYLWRVHWLWPVPADTVHPYALAAIVPRPGEARSGSLTDLVAVAEPTAVTAGHGRRMPTARFVADPALGVTVEEGHVTLRVRGPATVARLLRTLPDSVEFEWDNGSGYLKGVTLQVRRCAGALAPPVCRLTCAPPDGQTTWISVLC